MAVVYRQVRVHPVVLFTIVDSYRRRNDDAKRIIGTLVGNVEDGVVTIKYSFCVPHNETLDEVAVDMDFARTMFDLHKRITAHEVVVGWFATGNEITEHSALIHEYYSRETPTGVPPVHLTVDTSLRSNRMSFQAHVSMPMGTPGKTQGTLFSSVPCSIACLDAERVALQVLQRGRLTEAQPRGVSFPSYFDQVQQGCANMQEQLGALLKYVDDVISGKIGGDPSIGRHLLSLVTAVPRLDSHQLQTMLNGTMQDLLMVLYLSNLAQTPLALMEKVEGGPLPSAQASSGRFS